MPHLTWVNGIPSRPSATSWMRYLSDTILGDLSGHPPRPRTHEAEAGLGIAHSMYWYVATTVEAYAGEVVGLWEPRPDLDSADGGVCPFDSGGLWHRNITTLPPLADEADLIAYFRVCDNPLAGWQPAVANSLIVGWADPQDYVRGLPPSQPITPRDHAGNTSPQAWVWEGRVATSDQPVSRLELRDLFWTEGAKRRFFAWLLRYAGLSDVDRRTLLGVVQRVSRPVPEVFPGVHAHLLDLAAA